jgi:integrase
MGTENGEAQANRAFALLRTIYEKGREWGYTGENPCFKLKKFHEQSRERFLQESELSLFFQSVMSEPSENERDFILMLLYTGARKSNVLSMAWENVNMDLKLWNIPATQSKNKTSYTVPLVKAALDILTRRRQANPESPWVFTSHNSKSGHLEEPKKSWTRVLKRAGLEDVRMHDLRRTLGSWMAITGASLITISYALGHKLASLSVTAVYARASVEPIRQSMETAVRTMLRKGQILPDEENVIEYRASV